MHEYEEFLEAVEKGLAARRKKQENSGRFARMSGHDRDADLVYCNIQRDLAEAEREFNRYIRTITRGFCN